MLRHSHQTHICSTVLIFLLFVVCRFNNALSDRMSKRSTIAFAFLLQFGSFSPEDEYELQKMDEWIEMMADLESAESDHLIALAMR